MANEHSQIVPSMQPTAKVADFKFWCQKVLPLVYDDSLSYYEVLNKMVVYLNQVIDNINADIDNVEELEDDFLLLQEYVNNFFDDIDQLATYAERAEAAETAALSSAASAAESATNAASSAVNAATSSGSAATSALSAMDAKDAAVAAKTAAEAALANAQTAATNAAASATAASGSATNAAASATAAQNSFTLADAARQAAQSAASSATGDAEDAADSAASAASSAETAVNASGTITKTLENLPYAHIEDATASNVKNISVTIEPYQQGSGDASPTNIRPISGWTSTNITRTGKNILDVSSARQGGFDSTTGANNVALNDYVPIGENETYVWTTDVSSIEGRYIRCYDANKTQIGNVISMSGTGAKQFTTLAGTKYIRAMWYKSGGIAPADVANDQIEVGDTSDATEYEAYNGLSLDIDLPLDAGTVYGGILDIINKKLTVTKSKIPFPTSGWSDQQTLTNTKRYSFAHIGAANVGSNNVADILCTQYPVLANDSDTVHVTHRTTAIHAFVSKEDYPNTTAWQAYLAGLDTLPEVCFPLAEPLEYTLTDEQILTLLKGTNNVFTAKGGIASIEYFTNAENYISGQTNANKSLIAPVLTSMTADTALVPNDFRIVGDNLYRITANVSSGGTLTPDTNCVETTVGEILKSLLSE